MVKATEYTGDDTHIERKAGWLAGKLAGWSCDQSVSLALSWWYSAAPEWTVCRTMEADGHPN